MPLIAAIPAALGISAGTAAALGTAALGVGGAVISANAQKSAANDQLQAQQQAQQQQLQAQQQNADRIAALNQPFVTGGTSAFNALLAQYGLAPSGGAPAPANTNAMPAATGAAPVSGSPIAGQGSGVATGAPPPTGSQVTASLPGVADAQGYVTSSPAGAGAPGGAPAAGAYPGISPPGIANGNATFSGGTPGTAAVAPGFDPEAYLKNYPDVANSTWLAGLPDSMIGDQNGDGQVNQDDRAIWHYENYGQADGHVMPMTAGTPATAGTPSVQLTPNTSTNLMSAGARPTALPEPTFGAAPTSASYFSNFQQSPGFQFALDQAMRGANASYAGRGLLKSDAAVKGIMTQATGMANQDYNNWFSQQLQKLQSDQGQFNTDRQANYNIYNTDQNRQDNNFNTDRSFQTDQVNTNTDNLFKLANTGVSAAGATGAAGTNFANNATNIFQNGANATGAAANANAGANANLATTIGGIGTNFLNSVNLGGGNTPVPTVTSYTGANSPSLIRPQTYYPDLNTSGPQF